MRGFLFGILLGALAGVLYAPGTGTRTRSLIRDKYSQMSTDSQEMMHDMRTMVNEQAGPIKEKMMTMLDDMRMKLHDIRDMLEAKCGDIKGQLQSKKLEREQSSEDQFRQSA